MKVSTKRSIDRKTLPGKETLAMHERGTGHTESLTREKMCVFKYSIGNLSSLALLLKENYLKTWHFQGPTGNEERVKQFKRSRFGRNNH